MAQPNLPPNYVFNPPTTQEQTASVIPGPSVAAPTSLVGASIQLPVLANGAVLYGAGITVSYYRDRGLRMGAVAGTYPTQAAFWRCHGGFCVKVVSWVFTSLIAPPTVPLPITNANEQLLYETYVIPNNEQMADGTNIYVRAGQYSFGLQIPPADSDTLFGAVNQLDLSPLGLNVLNPGSYVANLIGPTSPPTGFSGQAINY